MAAIRFDVISIGTLSRNRLWNEPEPVRTAHATTTLIRTPKHHIVVDPGLPAPALAARLFERTGLGPDRIDMVFLTNFRPAHRAGLQLFDRARIYISEIEQQAAAQHLESILAQAPGEDIDRQFIEQERQLLNRLQPAPDELDENVDLFPLYGYTAGSSGLLLALPAITVLLAGGIVPTQDHFLAGQVLPDAHDVRAAQESLQEIYEIADLIVPGYDNVFMNPRTYGI